MLVILYPDNTAYPDNDIRVSIGTNETFSLPEKRTVPYGKQIEDAEIFPLGNDTVIAFYTHENYEARQRYIKNLQRYGKEYYKNAREKSLSFSEVGLVVHS